MDEKEKEKYNKGKRIRLFKKIRNYLFPLVNLVNNNLLRKEAFNLNLTDEGIKKHFIELIKKYIDNNKGCSLDNREECADSLLKNYCFTKSFCSLLQIFIIKII